MMHVKYEYHAWHKVYIKGMRWGNGVKDDTDDENDKDKTVELGLWLSW